MRSAPLLRSLLLGVLFGLSICAVLDKNDQRQWESLMGERDAFNAFLDASPEATATEGATGENSGGSPEVQTGLTPIGMRTATKTILLLDGEASETVSFRLVLNEKEQLRKVLHIVNDSTVITSNSKQVQQIGGTQGDSYNISITHDFEGDVGVASFLLHVTTTYTRYIASGTFYVSGIVAQVPGKQSSNDIVSGIGSPGLTFQTPDLASVDSSTGQIPLSIQYQALGPDVTETPLSLPEVIGTARISVKHSDPKTETPLINYNPTTCSSIQSVERDARGFYVFSDSHCGIGFDSSSQVLVLNLNRERGGDVVITIFIPTLTVDGEMFETSINVFVGAPVSPKPVILVHEEVDLVFDHYGSEVFNVLMYNTITPAQKLNATEYVMDLPGKRYAKIDFTLSKLVNPVQVITFKTLRPGDEDEAVWDLIQAALDSKGKSEADMMYEATPMPEISPPGELLIDLTRDLYQERNSTHPTLHLIQEQNSNLKINTPLGPRTSGKRAAVNEEDDSETVISDSLVGGEIISLSRNHEPRNNFTNFQSQDTSSVIPIRMKAMENPELYESNVHVQIPPKESLVTAVNSFNNSIRTTFAPKELAVIRAVDNGNTAEENIQVSMSMKDYAISTFSEHKAQQIKTALLGYTLSIENGTTGEANLIKLTNEGSSLVAVYEIALSGNSSKIATELSKRKELPSKISQDAYLENGRIAMLSARALSSKELPSNINGNEEPTSLSGAPSAGLVAAIVILSLVVAIPLFALCFGFIVTRRHSEDNENEPSNINTADSTAAEADGNSAVADPSVVSPESPAIARDTFGRAEGEEESFKMEKEMFKEGYFGDNAAPRNTQAD